MNGTIDKTIQLSGAIVLYNENPDELSKTIDSFLEIPLSKKLFLFDNLPNDGLKDCFIHPDIIYHNTKKNIGFGSAHNLAIPHIKNQSAYHLILNPDVVFKGEDLPRLIEAMNAEKNCALIAPGVRYPDGSHQYTCRKFPTPFDLLGRVIPLLGHISKRRIAEREYRHKDLTKPFYPDFIHGCFMLFRTADFIAINGFDPRYFLYMEDADICKKLDAKHQKRLYFPDVTISHIYKRKSRTNPKLMWYHSISALKYFLKWRGK
ncbi:MAG: glycosyl transferase family 2 [Flavobacteriales bacterium]|nr:MAG: glycosyl transferase family 2 [Flavobacteriales bacterium]